MITLKGSLIPQSLKASSKSYTEILVWKNAFRFPRESTRVFLKYLWDAGFDLAPVEVMVMDGKLDGAMEIFEKEEWDNGEKKA